MCGINGYKQYESNLNKEQIANLINSMNDNIFHRGPDEEGVFIQDNIGLGMRRLSIIDLKTGRQPIFNENKSLVIVMNGEIYNYRSLREDLLAKGHKFSTQSDTEVALHCFEEYGYLSFNKLKGMFAIAIYDLAQDKIILARDRAGEKPLYYYKGSNIFLFASELKSIINTGIIGKNINKSALNQFLQLTYIPAPLTIFEDIYKLLPGHYMIVDKDSKMITEQYWDVRFSEDGLIYDYDQCKKMLRETLFNAVEECMVSDVPIGAFLSGGIDSTTIVGIMSKISGKPVDTFTIGYKDKQHDESKKAKKVSEFHQTNHHLFNLEYNDALPELEKILSNIDEPFADSSLIPTYMISKLASQHVKTALTGDAGDELFGGYNKYLISFYSSRYKIIPRWFRNNLFEKAVYSLPDDKYLIRKIRKVIDNADKPLLEQRRNLMCLGFKDQELSSILKEEWVDSGSLDFIYDYYLTQQETEDELAHAFYTDFKVVLEGDMLTKVDRASMLCSLETRTPMLHKDVIELAARIPSEYKISSRKTKIILKDTFEDIIPNELLTASKIGFVVPIAKWLRGELKADLVAELNRDLIIEQGLFNYKYVDRTLREHLTQKRNHFSKLWALYIFQKWHKRIFD